MRGKGRDEPFNDGGTQPRPRLESRGGYPGIKGKPRERKETGGGEKKSNLEIWGKFL